MDNELVVYVSQRKTRNDIEAIARRYGRVVVGQSAHTGSYQVRFEDTFGYADILALSAEFEADDAAEAVCRNVAMNLDIESITGGSCMD